MKKTNQNTPTVRWALGLAALIAGGLIAGAQLVGPGVFGAKANEIPVTATFRDDAALPDRIGSDGLGTYIDGVDHVRAVLDGRGDFDLDTNSTGGPTVRTLFLDFRTPASPTANPPFATSTVQAFISTGAGGLPQMAIGSSTRSKLAVNFDASGKGWFIRFSPNEYPDTSSVLVSRVSVDAWEIEAAPTDIAKLLSYSTRGKLVLTDEGNFFMPLRVVVKRK